jgi:DNA-binding CsgD family transcriptional regulator
MREADFLAVSQAADTDALQRALVDFAHRRDFGLINLVLILGERHAHGNTRVVGNTPEAYLDVARDPELACRDPMNQRLMRAHTPFFYDQRTYTDAGAGDIWDAQAPFGYRYGAATALHLPGNEHVLVGFDRDRPLPTQERSRVRLLAELQLLVVHAREAAERLMPFRPVTPAGLPQLNAREIEVLRWTMHGKSAPVTAQIVGLSAATVNYHLQAAMRKLNVASKHQAVTLAISLGLL